MVQTKIEWADYTFNPWIGCTKVKGSPACAHCYAERWGHRFGVIWGKNQDRRRTAESTWRLPLSWDRQAKRNGTRPRVFCSSLADTFDEEVPDDWRDRLFDLITQTPHLDWLLLTKRAEKMRAYMTAQPDHKNIWCGVTAENQEQANVRIPHLLDTPAAKRFVSVEPMLGPVDLTALKDDATDNLFLDALGAKFWMPQGTASLPPRQISIENGRDYIDLSRGLDWVIAGGESGPHARPLHPDWARFLRDQCRAAGVPFFFKQWGEWAPMIGAVDGCTIDDDPEISRFDHLEWDEDRTCWGDPFNLMWFDFQDGNHDEKHVVSRIGKRRAGRCLDGKEHNEVPL